MSQKMEVISILVENNAGVLTRITSLFGRRNYNIDTLTVSTTEDPKMSKITITLTGNENTINQIIAQTCKLEEVHAVTVLEANNSVLREIILVKVYADDMNRGKIREVAEIYKASIVDLSPSSMILELTGKPIKIDAFLKVMKDFKVLEVCRTGVTAMARNNVAHTDDDAICITR